MKGADAYYLPAFPPKNGRVLQAEGSSDCATAVCAMIVGCTLLEAHEWAGSEPGSPWHDVVAAAFLLRHGVFMGLGFGMQEFLRIEATDSFVQEFCLDQKACYMGVRSRREPDGLHAVYWDGYVVWDPNPSMPDAVPLSEYEVSDFYPLLRAPRGAIELVSGLRLGK